MIRSKGKNGDRYREREKDGEIGRDIVCVCERERERKREYSQKLLSTFINKPMS